MMIKYIKVLFTILIPWNCYGFVLLDSPEDSASPFSVDSYIPVSEAMNSRADIMGRSLSLGALATDRESDHQYSIDLRALNEPLLMDEVLTDITDLFDKLPKPLKVVAAPNFGSLLYKMNLIKEELDRIKNKKGGNNEGFNYLTVGDNVLHTTRHDRKIGQELYGGDEITRQGRQESSKLPIRRSDNPDHQVIVDNAIHGQIFGASNNNEHIVVAQEDTFVPSVQIPMDATMSQKAKGIPYSNKPMSDKEFVKEKITGFKDNISKQGAIRDEFSLKGAVIHGNIELSQTLIPPTARLPIFNQNHIKRFDLQVEKQFGNNVDHKQHKQFEYFNLPLKNGFQPIPQSVLIPPPPPQSFRKNIGSKREKKTIILRFKPPHTQSVQKEQEEPHYGMDSNKASSNHILTYTDTIVTTPPEGKILSQVLGASLKVSSIEPVADGKSVRFKPSVAHVSNIPFTSSPKPPSPYLHTSTPTPPSRPYAYMQPKRMVFFPGPSKSRVTLSPKIQVNHASESSQVIRRDDFNVHGTNRHLTSPSPTKGSNGPQRLQNGTQPCECK